MKLYALLIVFLVASIIHISHCHKDDDISPEPMSQSWIDTIRLNIKEVFGQFKESKELGQQRKKMINYGCIWKVCSRTLKKTTPVTKEMKEKTAEKIMGINYGYIFGG